MPHLSSALTRSSKQGKQCHICPPPCCANRASAATCAMPHSPHPQHVHAVVVHGNQHAGIPRQRQLARQRGYFLGDAPQAVADRAWGQEGNMAWARGEAPHVGGMPVGRRAQLLDGVAQWFCCTHHWLGPSMAAAPHD